jgi:transcriptional regulator with XRE-family HTH domain
VATPLGEFLRGRRAALDPGVAGPAGGVGARRVAGLRREEVAARAGMSVDYYVRLEQGRERHPSAGVVDALARALDLDDDGRLHLHRLADLTPRSLPAPDAGSVAPALLALMRMWPANPALVLDPALDVLAANALAEAVFGGFAPSRNLAEAMFLDPAATSFYADWDDVAASVVAALRMNAGAYPDHPRLLHVVEHLQAAAPGFARLWAANHVRATRLERKRLVHPEVGPVTLEIQAFDVRAAPQQELVVYFAEPGSPSADALALLAAAPAAR